MESGGEGADFVAQDVLFGGVDALLLALVEVVAELFVDGFVHPVPGLLAAAGVEVAVLLGLATIGEDVVPGGVDAPFFVGRDG